MSADKYPSIFSRKIEAIVYVGYYVAIHQEHAPLFCSSTFSIWTHNSNYYFVFISIDLPSPPQLLRTCALTLVSGLTVARCAPVDLQTAPRWPNTCGLTLARSHTSARYVSWSSHSRGIWIDTCVCTNTAACEWLHSSVNKSRAW